MKYRILSLACLLSLFILLVAYTSSNLIKPTPTAIKPKQGLGGIVGKIQNPETRWAGKTVYVYASHFYQQGPDEGNGIYVLEPALDAHAAVEQDGFFQIGDVTPGLYVVVIGPEPEQSTIISDENNPKIIVVSSDEVIDLGLIILEGSAQSSPTP